MSLVVMCWMAWTPLASAYVNQADGTVLPVSDRTQQCLDLSEGTVLAVDAVSDAALLPEAYRPVLDTASGRYRVTFTDIGEGAGYRNSFGWFWVGEDVTNPANLRTIFGCRTYAACPCPCTTTRTVTVDFDTQPGFAPGRQIGFWLRTPQRLDGSVESGTFSTVGCSMSVGCDPSSANLDDSCGGRLDSNNRIYFTSAALNDDGDYVHFLVHRSATRTNTFYFGFEDLWRGNDNDFEDMLVRASGLLPECDPRPETCDNVDQDCDGMIDEGLSMACSTLCGAGTQVCTAGRFGACSARVPTSETCDNVDQDCDRNIDEGLSRACSNACGSGTEVCVAGAFADCTAPRPVIESCNNRDDDCDGRVDEGLARACSSACGSGTQVCAAGTYGSCSAPGPTSETCNADDDDCDGRVDEGLTRACSTMCGPGTEVCIAGSFSACNAPIARDEACNNTDDDCDGRVDEGIVRACSTACGPGMERCAAGRFMGCDAPTGSDEVCNNLDDDCDGVIDDGNPGGGAPCIPLPGGGYRAPTPEDSEFCRAGTVRCVGGALVCQGAASGSSEVCNCLDDDCDGRIDEETAADPLCPGGACIATECECASPCDPGEFPCPIGRVCDRSTGEPGYCVSGRCAGVICDDESVCSPDTGECRNLCTGVACSPGYACVRGGCVEDSCFGRGCPTGERCRLDPAGVAACEPDPCRTNTCGEGTFCRDGDCVPVCDVSCESGSVCRGGVCVPAPCGGCPEGSSCVDGACTVDRCAASCPRGRVCRGTACVADPCYGLACPEDTVCRDGECVDTTALPRPPVRRGVAQGGSCSVRPGGTPSSSSWGFVAFVSLALVVRRRRRSVVPTVGLALALAATGCSVDPFCFSGCDEGVDAGRVDTGRRPDVGPVDGCVSGGELCDTVDNDCDGEVDEDFELASNPRNCGRCGLVCSVPHAFPACREGECAIGRCEIGWVDLNGVPGDGCEYSCPPDGDELCDGRDNDCDGRLDEGFDRTSDRAHCGECGNVCVIANAETACADSRCVLTSCRAGYVDANRDPADGCEYRCTGSPTETCNGVDDDCDRSLDEGFDLRTDVANCGLCGRACSFVNGVPACVDGACAMTGCRPGFLDLDGDPRTGCEVACTPRGADTCNRVDDDCDGRIDEADPGVGAACGIATGACETGTMACVRGVLECVGDRAAIAELCNNEDDDCDGRTDESVPGAVIASVGDRCGATDLGRCAYGVIACSAGVLRCTGEVVGITETCNGVDDDCNGALDDRVTVPAASSVPSCAERRGVCAGRIPTCRGATGWACDLPMDYQAVETRCDGLDNDCDGTPDEGCLTASAADVHVDLQNADTSTNSLAPRIAVSGSNVQLTWTEAVPRSTVLDARVYSARSSDRGLVWATPVRLNTTDGDTFAPTVTIGDNVLWAWADFRGGSNYREIWTRRSSDAPGATLLGEARANATGPTGVTDAYGVQLVRGPSGLAYVAFEAFGSGRSRHIFLSRSSDNGASWSAPLQVSSPVSASFVAAQPRLAYAGGRAYIAWRDNRSGSLDAFVRVFSEATVAFAGPEVRVDTGTAAGSSTSFSVDLAAEGSNVYVTWVDDRDRGSFDIWFNRSTDGGSTWLGSAIKLDGSPLDHDSIEPHVVTAGAGNVLVGWLDYRSGFPDPFVARSTNAGLTFAAPVRLDTGTDPGESGSFDLAIAASGDLVAAAWADDRGGLLDIFANYSLDGGATFQVADVRLDSAPAGSSDSQAPAVAVADRRAHIAWVDHRRGAGCPVTSGTVCPNGDIYYRRLE